MWALDLEDSDLDLIDVVAVVVVEDVEGVGEIDNI